MTLPDDRKTYAVKPAQATTFKPFTVKARSFELASLAAADVLKCAVAKQVDMGRPQRLFTAAALAGGQLYFTIEPAQAPAVD